MSAGPTVHASAALVGEQGVLIRGASGSGKSALLLALITMDAEQNALAADDRVALAAHHGRVVASVPAELAGLIEVRGQGILRLPHVSPVVIDLVVDLVPLAEVPRMPEGDDAGTEIAGIWLPRLSLAAGASDGAIRVLTALTHGFARNP
jgi:HPr kinase/phosphorylase